MIILTIYRKETINYEATGRRQMTCEEMICRDQRNKAAAAVLLLHANKNIIVVYFQDVITCANASLHVKDILKW